MEILIISGLSGSGKSRTAAFLEDIGYYIVDNLPAEMMLKFANFCTASGVFRQAPWHRIGIWESIFRTASANSRTNSIVCCISLAFPGQAPEKPLTVKPACATIRSTPCSAAFTANKAS